MAGVDAADLTALCDELLAASIEALNTLPGIDVRLEGAPDRAFTSSGQPALDCCEDGQLSVNAAAISASPATGQTCKSGRTNYVGLTVTIGRCIPVGGDQGLPPSSEELDDAAAQTNADAWALWNHLYGLWCAGLLFSMCGGVFWDGMRALQPSGGCGGWVLALRVSLDGYDDVSS